LGYQRKHLSADGLLNTVRRYFNQAPLQVCKRSEFSWPDCLMSGLAIFGLKFPSLLKFEHHKSDPVIKGNLRHLYHVRDVPSDTTMRERLDVVEPKYIRKPFKAIFSSLQRGKVLPRFRYLKDYHLLSVDGTGLFSSHKVHCDNCCEKHHRNGEITYYHQLVGAAIVHPDEKVVIPIAPEPIIKGDGNNKNDCERNASKRLLKHFRREHPHLKTIILEDALASNYPHLSLLDELHLEYIIGVKPVDHKYLFDWIKETKEKEIIQHRPSKKRCDIKIKHTFHYYRNVPLNDEHHDYRVNVLEYWEEKPNGKKQHFSWVTSLEITEQNVYEIMRAGRARWKIENETFNTLKNQGYELEHNYGHGKENLCTNLSMLMMLAFLIDQVQYLCDKKYQSVKKKERTWYSVFEAIRGMFKVVIWDNWSQMYDFIIDPESQPPPNWFGIPIEIKK